MSQAALEFVRLGPDHEAALVEFFTALKTNGDDQHFHPHPMTSEQAAFLVRYAGKDLYYLAVQGGRVLGYAMLRGWDEGYAVPSLGIAVRREARGTGLARAFMHFLHASARAHGAPQVRLKVYPQNTAARRLYESVGYRWQPASGEQFVGLCDLAARAA